MCFSAQASFTAAAVLVVMGVVLLGRVKNRRHLPLALIPLFFGIQQGAEGYLWLHFAPDSWAKDLFLFFALLFWPVWIPFSFWMAEKEAGRRKVLVVCIGIGLAVAGILAFALPLTGVSMVGKSIQYHLPMAFSLHYVSLGLYAAAAVLPFFFSSLPYTSWCGLLFALAALLVGWLDKTHFISVWCFVSALLSLSLFFILKQNKTR